MRRRAWLGGLGAVLLALAVAACQTVEMTGRRQLLLLGEPQEWQMGLTAYREILGKSKLSDDPQANELVQRVGQRIASATGRTDYQWEFKVIEDSKTVNAFCLPGGKIAVYTGILPVTRDDNGLATVMGHEVAHAIARHGGERVSQGLLLQLGAAGLQVAMARKDPGAQQAVFTAFGVGAAIGFILPFSRSHELEADRMGLTFMARAGYDPRASIDFWRRMEQQSRGKNPPEFLSTHPGPGRRVTELERWMPEALKEYRPRP